MDTQPNALPTLAVLARTVSGCLNSAFLDISQHFTVHLFRPWIPSRARCQHLLSRSDRFRLLELRVFRTRTKPLCGGKDEGPARRRWTSATHATRTKFSPFLNEPLHGGNVPVTRRACVGLALLSPRVTSGLAKPPLLPRHSIHTLEQTACRLAASFKKPVPERPQRLAVKSSSAQALRVQASSLAACQSGAGWRVPCRRSSQRFQDEGKPKATSTFHHARLAVSSPAWSPVPRAWSWPEPEWPERPAGRGPWAWA